MNQDLKCILRYSSNESKYLLCKYAYKKGCNESKINKLKIILCPIYNRFLDGLVCECMMRKKYYDSPIVFYRQSYKSPIINCMKYEALNKKILNWSRFIFFRMRFDKYSKEVAFSYNKCAY